MYRVMLIDDESLIVEGLRKVVRWADYGCEVVATAEDARSGTELIREKQPQILFTDIRMPGQDGLTMLAGLRSEFPDMQVTVLTGYRDFEYARQAIRLGVCRYMLKPSDLEELQEAVREMVRRLDSQQDRAEEAESPEDQAAHGYVVENALSWMREHCTEHISLEDVASQVFVSQWHLSKLINRETGMGFLDLISRMRVEQAKKLLADPARRISDAAYESGFSDVAHFSKTFKKITGQTPGEYRNSAGRRP